MDRAKQHRLLLRIGDLLDACGDCPKRSASGDPDKVHAGCPIYEGIRADGNRLMALERRRKPTRGLVSEDKPPKIDRMNGLTIKAYRRLKKKKIRDKDIAARFKITYDQLSYWKHKNGLMKPKRHTPDEDILEQILAGKSDWWIQNRLSVSIGRIKRVRDTVESAGLRERVRPDDSDDL